MNRKLPGKLLQFCAGFSTLLEDNVKNVCKHYEESFCSESTFLEMLSRCLFVFAFFSPLKVVRTPFLISHTLHSIFLLHLLIKGN